MKKIGLLTALDPLDKTAWSGIYFKVYETLKNQGFDVIILGPYPKSKKAARLIFLIEKFVKFFSSKRYYHHGSIASAFFRGKYFTRIIKNTDCDIVFGVTAASEIAFLKTDKPIFYFTDASFGQLSTYYSNFNDLSRLSRWEANYVEKKALDKCKHIIYPSLWAKDYTLNYYGVSAYKLKVFKMGANLSFPDKINDRKTLKSRIKFLFLGVDWERKGGHLVLETLNELKRKKYDLELIVCGCTPTVKEEYVQIIPFLNKNIKKDIEQLQQLLTDSHFLFLPTKAECYGIVFAEASAYGLPSITRDTGGVSSVVKDGINGLVLDASASANDFVKKIEEILVNQDEYLKLVNSSRKHFDNELDWPIFGVKFAELVGLEN